MKRIAIILLIIIFSIVSLSSVQSVSATEEPSIWNDFIGWIENLFQNPLAIWHSFDEEWVGGGTGVCYSDSSKTISCNNDDYPEGDLRCIISMKDCSGNHIATGTTTGGHDLTFQCSDFASACKYKVTYQYDETYDNNYNSCELHRCYNDDVYCYDSNGDIQDKYEECGTGGCSMGECNDNNNPCDSCYWSNVECGGVPCSTTYMKQIEVCPGCSDDGTTRCVSDSSCQCISDGETWVDSPSECCNVGCSDKRCVANSADCGTCASSPGMSCSASVPCCMSGASGGTGWIDLECINGVCVEINQQADTCSDSDSSHSWILDETQQYTTGTISGSSSNQDFSDTDYCINSMHLNEYYCNTNPSVNENCVGHTCSLSVNCNWGCVNGACSDEEPQTCSDSDSGKDYYTQGTLIASQGHTGTDFCIGANDGSSNELKEYFCSEDNRGDYETHICDNNEACANGACYNLGNQCSNGIQDNNEEGIDCGGSCPNSCNTCNEQDQLLNKYCQDNSVYENWTKNCENEQVFKESCINNQICTNGACLQQCDSSTCSWGEWSNCENNITSREYLCSDPQCSLNSTETRNCGTDNECTDDKVWVCGYNSTDKEGISVTNPCFAKEAGYTAPCSSTNTEQCYMVGKCETDSNINSSSLIIIGILIMGGLIAFAFKK